ncbi:MAG: class I SAM-dependent methyltransferase [Clostridia bacterium]|nr:class I SAM-dependent methyltransferase [Clostridia bacterium]
MSEYINKVMEHYDSNPKKEWDRLQKRFPAEKYITLKMMDRYIRPGDRILDIGGGPGHYSIAYARRGHDVTLLDLSSGNVRLAKRKASQYKTRIDAQQGNALDLSRFPDESFDIVFLMGPLYHLTEEEDRLQAIREAKRVLKKGGYLFCSFILMFGGVIYAMRELPVLLFGEKEQVHFETAARVESKSFCSFTWTYMTTVKDAKAHFDHFTDLETVSVFGQEGILAPYTHNMSAQSRKVREAWYDYAVRYCDREEYLTHSEHLAVISRKI